MTDLIQAAIRAADWLSANRDKHITGALALNEQGREVRFDDPDAECFCALGRLGKELGLTIPYGEIGYGPLNKALGDDRVGEIFSENDRTPLEDHKHGYHFASCDGVEALRRLARGEPIDV